MNKQVSMEQLIPVFQEVWDRGKSVNFTPSGNSMLPMLRDKKDQVVLSPAKGKLKKYDLPLYNYHGRFILHRVYKVNKNGTYTMLGDNRNTCEFGVTDDDIYALVTSFTRDGKTYSVKNIKYRFYCRYWVNRKKFKWKYYSLKEKLYPYYRKIRRK